MSERFNIFGETPEQVIERLQKTNAALVEIAKAALTFAEDELEVRGDEDAEYDMPAKPHIEAIVAALKLAEGQS